MELRVYALLRQISVYGWRRFVSPTGAFMFPFIVEAWYLVFHHTAGSRSVVFKKDSTMSKRRDVSLDKFTCVFMYKTSAHSWCHSVHFDIALWRFTVHYAKLTFSDQNISRKSKRLEDVPERNGLKKIQKRVDLPSCSLKSQNIHCNQRKNRVHKHQHPFEKAVPRKNYH